MSYANMDHAEWVEMNNAAGKRQCVGRKPKRDRYGSLIGYAAAPEKLSEFQAKAMDILGITRGGIYNASIAWETVDWNCAGGLSLIWQGGMSTFDFNALSRFVFLCHEARIRGDISPAGPRMLRITMTPRRHDGGYMRRHPNLDEAVAEFREYLPADHRIRYRAPGASADATDPCCAVNVKISDDQPLGTVTLVDSVGKHVLKVTDLVGFPADIKFSGRLMYRGHDVDKIIDGLETE